MNFHTWNNQILSSIKNSGMKRLICVHCFQSFEQLKILSFNAHSLAPSVQSPTFRIQLPVSRVQRPETAKSVTDLSRIKTIQKQEWKILLLKVRYCRYHRSITNKILAYKTTNEISSTKILFNLIFVQKTTVPKEIHKAVVTDRKKLF